MDVPLVAGTIATVVFAVSNLPMLRKALRTRDVSSYSLPSMIMINGANVVYSLYVFTLPFGPIWGLHTFYVVSCAIMLVLCLRQRAGGRSRGGRAVAERGHAVGRTSNPRSPVSAASVTIAVSTCAPGGPCAIHAITSST